MSDQQDYGFIDQKCTASGSESNHFGLENILFF